MTDHPQRIALLGPSAERHRGGIAQFTSQLAARLSAEATTQFYSWHELYPRFLIHRELETSAPAASSTRYSLGFLSPRSWLKTADMLAEFDPQRIYFTWSHAVHAPIYSTMLRRLRRKCSAELVCIAHNILPHESFFGARELTRSCVSRFDSIVVHSESDAAKLRELLPNARVRTLFLPLFDFLPPALAAGGSDKNKYLLFFGSIRPYKGLDVLLRALPLVRQQFPNVKLHIAGELFSNSAGSWTKFFSRPQPNPLELVSELGLKDAVTSDLRYLRDDELPALFDRAQIAVFPFRSTNQSATINAAFAYGVPVAASNVGGLTEYVTEGVNGTLVEPNSPEALADGILRLLKTPIAPSDVHLSTRSLSWERYVRELLSDASDPTRAVEIARL